MSKDVKITLRVRSQGDGLDHTDVFVFENTTAPGPYYTVATQGYNTWSSGLFANTHVFLVVPPVSTSGNPTQSGVGKTLVGAPSDVGVPLDPAVAHLLPVAFLSLIYAAQEPVWFVLA